MNNRSSNNSNENRFGMDHSLGDATHQFGNSKVISSCFVKSRNYKQKRFEKTSRAKTKVKREAFQ
jgi:hypothetical protein